MDKVWDYFENSLKSETRRKHGKGARRVEVSNCLPTKWQRFLRVNDKSAELFAFLTWRDGQIATDNLVVVTYGFNVS